ncbi:MAG: hypothetical protein ACRDD3_10560 [Azovibrio sp.]
MLWIRPVIYRLDLIATDAAIRAFQHQAVFCEGDHFTVDEAEESIGNDVFLAIHISSRTGSTFFALKGDGEALTALLAVCKVLAQAQGACPGSGAA